MSLTITRRCFGPRDAVQGTVPLAFAYLPATRLGVEGRKRGGPWKITCSWCQLGSVAGQGLRHPRTPQDTPVWGFALSLRVCFLSAGGQRLNRAQCRRRLEIRAPDIRRSTGHGGGRGLGRRDSRGLHPQRGPNPPVAAAAALCPRLPVSPGGPGTRTQSEWGQWVLTFCRCRRRYGRTFCKRGERRYPQENTAEELAGRGARPVARKAAGEHRPGAGRRRSEARGSEGSSTG